VNSRLELVGLDCLRLRGLRKVLMHGLFCMFVVLLIGVAAVRMGRLDKVRSVYSF